MVSVYHAFSFFCLKYIIPLFLVFTPFVLSGGVRMKLKIRDAALGLLVSAVILLPFWFVMGLGEKRLQLPQLPAIGFQLVGISLPEEIYFRGFLQECLGNNIRGVFLSSLLFAVMHAPQLLIYGDWHSLLTFFPSLVMGFLYMRTSNVLPSAIFHFSANILFLGLYDILSYRFF